MVCMPVDIKGKQILRDPHYIQLRQNLIDEIMKKIDEEGKHGIELREYIMEALKDDRYQPLIKEMMAKVEERANIRKEDCRKVLAVLLEEDIAGDIKKNMGDNIEEKEEGGWAGEKSRINREGEKKKLWRDAPMRYLGSRKIPLKDLWDILRENKFIDTVIITGIVLLVASALLLGSPYDALVAGLTLTTAPGEEIRTMAGNIIGAIGGILIFFVAISLIFQYMLLIRTRDDRIRERANRYLERRGK